MARRHPIYITGSEANERAWEHWSENLCPAHLDTGSLEAADAFADWLAEGEEEYGERLAEARAEERGR